MTNIIKHVFTDAGRSSRLLEFIRGNDNFFFSISKSDPWLDDTNPPTPTPEDKVSISDLILLKRVTTVSMARTVSCASTNDLLCDNTYYRLYSEDEVINDDQTFNVYPTHIYLSTEILSTDYTSSSFRIVGLHTNVKFKPSISHDNSMYLSSDLESLGITQWLAYTTPIDRIEDKNHVLQTVIKMRG